MATLPSNYDRYDDFPPWWGGDQIWNKMLGGACTSGFAVVDPGGQDAVLTASHCGPPASIDDISDWCGSRGLHAKIPEASSVRLSTTGAGTTAHVLANTKLLALISKPYGRQALAKAMSTMVLAGRGPIPGTQF